MSAPALRPTARVRPVLLACLERQRGDYWGALGLAACCVWLRMSSGRVGDLAVVLGFVLVGFLPAAPHERQPAWDAAMPVDPARYALVRLVCSVVRAAFLLAVVTGVYAALFADPEHPGWYPLALFAWGLTCHLLVSAAFLRPLVHPAVTALCALALMGGLVLLGFRDPAEFRQMGVSKVLARTALPLGLAGAAAYAATRFQARAPKPAGPAARYARAPRRDPARTPASRPAPHPLRRTGPARPSATLTVFRRHFALLGRFAIVPALTLLVFAWGVLMQLITGTPGTEEGWTVRWFVESTGVRGVCAWIALSWTGLVWLREHGAQRRWNDTLPVGTGKRRVLHAAAGAAWLLLFVPVVVAAPLVAAAAAGTLASPADVPAWLWVGLPLQTLTLYLAATLVFFGTRLVFQVTPAVVPYVGPDRVLRVLPVRLGIPFAMAVMMLALAVVPVLFFMWATGHLEKLVLAVAGDANPHGWSYAASALWVVVHAAAAAGAIALNDWIHRAGRLPTIHEVRGLLHGWAGRRPAPALRGHAGP